MATSYATVDDITALWRSLTDDETVRAEALLVARGQEKLAEYQKSETASSDVDPQSNLIYKEDYDLGDYCTYVNTEIGVEMEQQITEIQETYEGAAMSLAITLGNEGVSTIQQLIKREA